MLWRVQSAWSGGIHLGFAGLEENLARRDVERLLRDWMVPNLLKATALYAGGGPKRSNFGFEAKMAADAIARYIDDGDVWSAYDQLHNFQDRWAEMIDLPPWFITGTVILEAPRGKGPQTRKRFLTLDDFPEGRQPNLGSSNLGNSSLGSLRRWTVSFREIGGGLNSSIFLKEEEALARAGYLLRLLARRLHAHASAEALASIDEDRLQYADEAVQLVFHITDLLKAGYPVLAYERWKAFEKRYQGLFARPTLAELVGGVDIQLGRPSALGEAPSLGALRRWRIRVDTPGEPMEESTHLVEAEALAHAKRALEGILDRAMFQLEVWADALYRRRRVDDYDVTLRGAVDFTKDMLDRGAIHQAISNWIEFQAYDSEFAKEGNMVGPPPIGPLIGTLSVEVG